MNFIILTPFGRSHNAKDLTESVKASMVGMKGKLRWIIITDNRSHLPLFENEEVILVIQKPGWFAPYHMLNAALDQVLPIDDHTNTYVGELSDDDAFEPEFFRLLEEAAEVNRKDGQTPEVLAVSMKRWHSTDYVVDTLNPTIDTMRVGMVGQEQLFIRADVMALHRFQNTNCSDGILAEKLAKERPNGFCFFHHIFVHWNKFRP